MADTLYLEVDKSNGAILSYSVTKLESKASDYIEATETELNYLNAVEANLPPGMVTTLSDLEGYRARAKKIALLEFQLAQSRGKVAQAQTKAAKLRAELAATLAEKAALLSAGAAKHGMAVAEYEAQLITQYRALQAGTDAPQAKSGRTRSETAQKLAKFMADAKRKSYQ
ncbi:hypothetical protein [Pseudomonas sp. P8_241]|uniref:hypothetical protein n=1 Tax=Pseudomonas sp. P8_241 TaxID=3043445 RepID=UPI002A363CCA|nr:hypothetical protein [Pseudomonas sp. P8_241]WPN48661.1 hypothetical protein QMK58_08335 [Pseudomonas sp. P8_241]